MEDKYLGLEELVIQLEHIVLKTSSDPWLQQQSDEFLKPIGNTIAPLEHLTALYYQVKNRIENKEISSEIYSPKIEKLDFFIKRYSPLIDNLSRIIRDSYLMLLGAIKGLEHNDEILELELLARQANEANRKLLTEILETNEYDKILKLLDNLSYSLTLTDQVSLKHPNREYLQNSLKKMKNDLDTCESLALIYEVFN